MSAERKGMSNTPRTDAVDKGLSDVYGYPTTPHKMLTHAQALERDLARLMAENERHEELFEQIDKWADAYPTDLWPEVHKADWPSIDRDLTAAGWSLSRISASNMRHVIARIKELADKVRALKGEPK